MKHAKKTRAALVVLQLAAAGTLWAQDTALSPDGIWKTQDGRALVKIGNCDGNSQKKCGKIVDLKWPNDPQTGQPKMDAKNDDNALRSRPLMGLQNVQGFVQDGASKELWTDGTIYSPREGKTYNANMTVINEETLELRGYVGVPLFGKTQTWTKVKDGFKLEKGDPKDDKPEDEE